MAVCQLKNVPTAGRSRHLLWRMILNLEGVLVSAKVGKRARCDGDYLSATTTRTLKMLKPCEEAANITTRITLPPAFANPSWKARRLASTLADHPPASQR